ncbi:MAG: M23 family metallopeptidase, partial [Phaeodactylibacter sp.]|nr:M23 family metallopeptidase [Phaeodactylibacter sp.]
IDIPAERGTPVIAVADGEVVRVANKGGGGKQVWLQVGSRQFFYAHLDSWEVREGQRVRQGEVLGTVGNTGNASHTRPHLHFGVYVDRHETIDPAPLFE